MMQFGGIVCDKNCNPWCGDCDKEMVISDPWGTEEHYSCPKCGKKIEIETYHDNLYQIKRKDET